jgi:cytochrome c oxidase subunit 2
MSYLFSFILNPVYCDAPEPWQIGFQDGATPTFEGITELHNAIFFYLVVILVGVVWIMRSVVLNFSSSKTSIIYKYANHGIKCVPPMEVLVY